MTTEDLQAVMKARAERAALEARDATLPQLNPEGAGRSAAAVILDAVLVLTLFGGAAACAWLAIVVMAGVGVGK